MSKDSNIPENYFKNLQSKLWGKIDQMDDNVEANAPQFHALSQSNPYTVPKKYFESFRNRLQSKLEAKVISLDIIRPYLVAASIIAVAVLSWVMMPQAEKDLEGDNLMYADVYEYYADDLDLLDEELLVDFGSEILAEDEYEQASLITEDLTEEEINLYEEAILQEMTDQELLGIL